MSNVGEHFGGVFCWFVRFWMIFNAKPYIFSIFGYFFGYPNHLTHAKTASCRLVQVISNLGAGAPEFVPLAQQLQELGRTGPRAARWSLGGWKIPSFWMKKKLDCLIYHSLSWFIMSKILVGKCHDPNCCWWFYPKSWISGSREVHRTHRTTCPRQVSMTLANWASPPRQA